MASYGGYTKASYGIDDQAGGGFMAGSQTGSQGGQRNYNEDSLRPVLVKQIIDVEEAYPGAGEYTLDGGALSQLTLVGQVRSVNVQPTNVTYRLDDGSGMMEVKKWIDADRSTEEADQAFAVGQYIRVFGRIKQLSQRRYIGAHFLRAVDDYNEVSYHLLEAAYVHLALTRGTTGSGSASAGAAGGGAAGGVEKGMFVDQTGNAAYQHFSRDAQKVLYFLQNMPTGNEGVNINVITNELHISYGVAMDSLQELSNGSLVYATVDDETFALM